MTRRKYHLIWEQESRLMDVPPEERPDVWRTLGEEMGFDPATVRPVPGEASQFTAEDAAPLPE